MLYAAVWGSEARRLGLPRILSVLEYAKNAATSSLQHVNTKRVRDHAARTTEVYLMAVSN